MTTTIATTITDATDYEKAELHKLRTELKDHSIAIGSWAIGAKNELAEQGGLIALALAERIGYDFNIRQSIMRVNMALAGYEDSNASQAYQLRKRAEVLIMDSALQVRDMLVRGVL